MMRMLLFAVVAGGPQVPTTLAPQVTATVAIILVRQVTATVGVDITLAPQVTATVPAAAAATRTPTLILTEVYVTRNSKFYNFSNMDSHLFLNDILRRERHSCFTITTRCTLCLK